jgi:hypothetical protein
MPSRVHDEMSIIRSQKFNCAAGQRYLLPTILTSDIVLSVEAIVAWDLVVRGPPISSSYNPKNYTL